MSDIRFEGWLHRSGTGGVYQDSAGNVGIASTQPQQKLDIGNGGFTVGPTGITTITTLNTTNIINATPLTNRNLIINGAMTVAQRGTSSTSTNYATVDRYQCMSGSTNEAPTQAQADVSSGTTPYTLGFRKSYKITNGNQTSGAQAGSYIYIRQKIEAQNVAQSGWNYTSSSSYITLSFWVKSSVAQNFYGHLKTVDGTGQNYIFETGSLSADTWTKVTKTVPGNGNITIDNNNAQGLELHIAPFYGTNYTDSSSLNTWAAYSSSSKVADMTSTWYTTNDSTFELTGIQLEVGSVATPFEHLGYAGELARCQRYYYRHAFGSSEAGSQSASNDNMAVGMCAMYTGSAGFGFIPYPVTMRTLPTLENATGTDYYRVYANGGADQFNDISTQQFGINGSVINYYDGFSRTQGHAGWIQIYNANAYIAFKAEL